MQSGMWRGTYGKPKAHDCPVRGVSTDTFNQIVISAGSNGELKFWKFENKGKNFGSI